MINLELTKQQFCRQLVNSGFSLVEVIVAAALLAISASAAVTLFSSSRLLFERSKAQDEEQIAINADLAEIERRNRRFACLAGSCSLSASDPDEREYTPDHPGGLPTDSTYATFEAQMALFQSQCAQPQEGASDLLKSFKTAALDTLPAMTEGVTRNYDITTASTETPPTPHAYVVIYAKNDQILRMARLVPTVARWCP
jgi:prepilin-type N-terminal cleavage/methylation domain-containing protein